MKRDYVASMAWGMVTVAGIAVVGFGAGSWLAATVVTTVGLLGHALAGIEYLRGRREGLAEFGAAVQAELAQMTTADRLTDALIE